MDRLCTYCTHLLGVLRLGLGVTSITEQLLWRLIRDRRTEASEGLGPGKHPASYLLTCILGRTTCRARSVNEKASKIVKTNFFRVVC